MAEPFSVEDSTTQIDADSKIAVANVRVAPEDHLQGYRFDPRGVHLVNFLRAGSILGKERAQSGGDGNHQCGQVPIRDVGTGLRVVRSVLSGSVVSSPDLELVVKPLLVVFGRSGI
jgi:hypothetical protein